MKTLTSIALITLSLFLFSFKPLKHETIKFPNLSLTDLNGKKLQDSELNSGKTTIICFWSVFDLTSIETVNAIYEAYSSKKDEVRIIAVSTDNNFDQARAKVLFLGWNFEVYSDPNQDYKRSMGVGNIQMTFVTDVDGQIIYSAADNKSQDEMVLFDAIDNTIASNSERHLIVRAN